jgi:hypothetical protein
MAVQFRCWLSTSRRTQHELPHQRRPCITYLFDCEIEHRHALDGMAKNLLVDLLGGTLILEDQVLDGARELPEHCSDIMSLRRTIQPIPLAIWCANYPA